MQCPRCKGRMYSQRYIHFVKSFDAWKCVNCGEVIDQVILTNRTRRVKKEVT
jgi:uncharacterized Zn finger protein